MLVPGSRPGVSAKCLGLQQFVVTLTVPLYSPWQEGAFYYRYKFPHAPRFTPLEEEAIRCDRCSPTILPDHQSISNEFETSLRLSYAPPRTFTALATSDELRLDYRMQPGDIAFLSNLTMVHAKTAFKVSRVGTAALRVYAMYQPVTEVAWSYV